MHFLYMNLVFWIISGAIAGGIVTIIMGRLKQIIVLGINIVVGIFGAYLGGFVTLHNIGTFESYFVGSPDYKGYALQWNDFVLPALITAIFGATILLFLVEFAYRKSKENFRLFRKQTNASGSVSVPPKQETPIPAVPTANKQDLPRIESEKDIGGVSKDAASKAVPDVIFISYRRSDSAYVAGRIYDRLVADFGKASVFKDVDSIPLGLDFKEYLDEKVGECSVLLAIIGDSWLQATDAPGKRRLDDPGDFVRIEIESALARKIPVIPLLIDGARMPLEDELPASIRKLVYRNGIAIRPDPDFHRDMDRLISALRTYF